MSDNPMVDAIRRNFRLYMVQRRIFCPITDEVLDIDTAVFVLDKFGEATAVFSPNAYRKIISMGVDPANTLEPGFTWDLDTIPSDC